MRSQYRFKATDFPTSRQLSLRGLDDIYPYNYDFARAYVIELAHKRLRRAARAVERDYLYWPEATGVADSDLLQLLQAYSLIRCCKEAPPYVVYVLKSDI